jgi:hypothetical protein
MVQYVQKNLNRTYTILDDGNLVMTLKRNPTIADGRCYFAATFGKIYNTDYNFTYDIGRNSSLSDDLNDKIEDFIECIKKLRKEDNDVYLNSSELYNSLSDSGKSQNYNGNYIIINTFEEYYGLLNKPAVSNGLYIWAEGDILNPLMELCFRRKIYIINDKNLDLEIKDRKSSINQQIENPEDERNVYIWYNGTDHYERMSRTQLSNSPLLTSAFQRSDNNTNTNTNLKSSNISDKKILGNKSSQPSSDAIGSTSGGYQLSCRTEHYGKTVTFTISDLEGNYPPYLIFTLQLLNSEGLVYPYGNNNVLKINELNKCIQHNNITISLEQYYTFDNNRKWSNLFQFTLNTGFNENIILYAVVTNEGCVSVTNSSEIVTTYNNFAPFDRVDNNIISDNTTHPVTDTPDESVPRSPFESILSKITPRKHRALNEIRNLSTYVNEIVMNPHHNINGLTSITKRYYSTSIDNNTSIDNSSRCPQLNDEFGELIRENVASKNIPIEEQITLKNQKIEMDKLRKTTKSNCDRLDIRHDIRTILQEYIAIYILNSNEISLFTDEDLADRSVSQSKLLEAAELILEEVQKELLKKGYIFEKIPPTIQQTKNQVFTEFIADVIIKANVEGKDITEVLPFVYEESGRGLNFVNFKKFYNNELKDNKNDRDLFYSNLYEIIINKINYRDINQINKYVEDILNSVDNPTTIPKSKIQQIDACKVGRTQTNDNHIGGTIYEVFGCLNVEIIYKGLDGNNKNTYEVKITNSLSGDSLMTCDVIQDIPLNAVSSYLNSHFFDLITLRNRDGNIQTADTRGDECEDDSGVGGGKFTNEQFSTTEPRVRALCIEALKTVCDKLYKLSGDEVEKISTVDDLVRVDPRVDYLFGKRENCPSVYRSSANGYFVYGGTTTENNDYSDIFYRNYVFICFLYNSSRDVLGKSNSSSDVLGKLGVTEFVNLPSNEELPKIRSNRLVNYIDRLSVVHSDLCNDVDTNTNRFTAYELWMIKIICCELKDKIQKIKDYIANVNTIVNNYYSGIKKFEEFYRSIIGLDNLEQLLTMSSLNFYYSNEDNIFNPERINVPENTLEDYGFSGEWIIKTQEKEKTAPKDNIGDLLDKIEKVEFFNNGIEITPHQDVTVSNETKITFDSEEGNKISKELLELLDKYDEGTISNSKLVSQFGTVKKSPTLTTSTKLELLFKLLNKLKKKEQMPKETTNDTRKSDRKKPDEQKRKSIQEIINIIKKVIINITQDFMNQIGIKCSGSTNTYLETILSSQNNESVSDLDSTFREETNNTNTSSENMVVDSDSFVEENKTTYRVGPTSALSPTAEVLTNTILTGKIGEFISLPSSMDTSSSSSSETSFQGIPVEKYQNTPPPPPPRRGIKNTTLVPPPESPPPGPPPPPPRTLKRKNKGGRKPKVTRRKNKKSPKRKTIKKRKMPKRKNKTRRQRK